MHLLENIFNYLPTQCLRCKCMQTFPLRNICNPCFAEIPRILSSCRMCGIPTSMPVPACGKCLNSKGFITQSCIPCLYAPPVDVWLRALKDNRSFQALPVLSQLVFESLQHEKISIDLIVPMPIHRTRRLTRGYNQAELLANMLSTLSGKPVNRKILTRSRKVKSQRSLSRSARIQNQRNSFRLINADGLRGKKILLVDDIVTTDSTVNQAAAELISGDAKNVILAAVARTEGHSRI